MKKVLYTVLAILVCSFVAVPTWAQKGGHGRGAGKGASASAHSVSSHTPMSTERSNKGGEVRGVERAEEVQAMNPKGEPAPGLQKAEEQVKKEAVHGKKAEGKHHKEAQHGKGSDKP